LLGAAQQGIEVTQMNCLDLSSLVIDKETVSIAGYRVLLFQSGNFGLFRQQSCLLETNKV
jgi:hypothetical protein